MERHGKRSSFGRRYFSRPPLRSYHFWVSTLFVLVVASEAVFFTVSLRAHLDSEASASMILPAVVMSVLWFKLLRSNQNVYEAYRDAPAAMVDQHPAAETVLDNLAYLSYAGFGLALFALGSVYVALAWGIAACTHR
jgi:hypothetical protein